MDIVIPILVFAVIAWIYLVVPAQMAGRRNRNALVWVAISIVGSPLLAILLLIALGQAPGNGPA